MSYNVNTDGEFQMPPEAAVCVRRISKMFRLFNSPKDMLKQQIWRHKKFYAEFWALKEISFDVKQCEVMGILGHNGAGKSTLLQILSGTMAPTSGYVYIRGRIGSIMTMGSSFKQDFTGRENVFILGSLLGLSKKQIHAHMGWIREFADIGIFFDKPIRTYSSGMVARLAFAVYTSLKPDLLIVDEVIGVGDLAFIQKCHEHISNLIAAGMSMILVSHNMNIMRQFCHRAMVLQHGAIICEGSVDQAISAYNKIRPRK